MDKIWVILKDIERIELNFVITKCTEIKLKSPFMKDHK